ncbi:hypothetical protein HZA97_01405 [Candidatus Woesearchaeota archaeon]|nr:hypothetical protein [Candidatus Woesearchaeota archaeon]
MKTQPIQNLLQRIEEELEQRTRDEVASSLTVEEVMDAVGTDWFEPANSREKFIADLKPDSLGSAGYEITLSNQSLTIYRAEYPTPNRTQSTSRRTNIFARLTGTEAREAFDELRTKFRQIEDKKYELANKPEIFFGRGDIKGYN